MTFFVETAGDPADLVDAVRKRLALADALVRAAFRIQTMREHMNSARSEERSTVFVAGALGALGLLLAAAGLFGVTLFAVSRRTREFGVRFALGATGPTLARQVSGESAALVAAGLAVGAFLAYGGYLNSAVSSTACRPGIRRAWSGPRRSSLPSRSRRRSSRRFAQPASIPIVALRQD